MFDILWLVCLTCLRVVYACIYCGELRKTIGISNALNDIIEIMLSLPNLVSNYLK